MLTTQESMYKVGGLTRVREMTYQSFHIILERTMSKLEELLAQQEALKSQIEEAKKQQKEEDLKRVRELCRAHGFTATMLRNYLAKGRAPRSKAKAQAKTKA
jgi:DNA-binding protein H-NS